MRRGFVALLAVSTLLGSAPAALAQCTGDYAPTCSLRKAAPVVFLGSIESAADGVFHFRVEEAFAGVKGSTIDVLHIAPVEGSTGYVEGETRYLVFAQTFLEEDGGRRAYVGGCGRQMMPFAWAGPDLEQLRREKSGRRVAAAFGRLIRTADEGNGLFDARDAGVLPDVALRFQSDRGIVTAKTRPDGTFVVERLPKGTYRIAADLPAGLKLGHPILDEPLEPIEVESDTCYDLVLTAVPTGRISGRVIGPDGLPRDDLRVSLLRADDPARAMDAWQGDGRPFEFKMIPPGDYLLAFGNGNPIDPDHPFPDTFYPSAPDIASATVIHLGPGQQILDADIHLPAGRPTRRLDIVVNWNGVRAADTYGANVTATVTGSQAPSARKTADDTYTVNLLTDATYRIRATAVCRRPGVDAATTDTMVVDGSDASVTRVTLTFAPGGCPSK